MTTHTRKDVRQRLIEDQRTILSRMESDAKKLLSISQYLEATQVEVAS